MVFASDLSFILLGSNKRLSFLILSGFKISSASFSISFCGLFDDVVLFEVEVDAVAVEVVVETEVDEEDEA